jgi:glycerol kinase
LVIDVGTSGIRTAVVTDDATVSHVRHRPFLPSTPFPGLVEFDPDAMAALVIELCRETLREAGPVHGIGIANQRASTIVWDAETSEAVGPGLGWQDLRTFGDCLALQADGIRLMPNQTATKAAHLLDLADPDRTRSLLVGTVESWLVWHLTEGSIHVTDRTNAAVTGLLAGDASDWADPVLQRLRIDRASLPLVTDSVGVVAEAIGLPGAPPIAGLVGDQQASLIGQGCVRPGLAKITFGTGGMLDVWTGPARPGFAERGEHGTFPIVALSTAGTVSWGVEGIMLAAGSNVEWLRDDLGIIASAEESDSLAAACDDADGVVYVPHLLGEGTPGWDLGARGALLGVTRGTERRHVARAVLEGVAHAAVDLVDAAEADTGLRIERLRIDGGMSANATFVQALADASGRPIEVSPEREATTVGAGLAAGLALGAWRDVDELAGLWHPARVVEPRRPADRDRWREALARAAGWHPELSAIRL